MDSKEKRWVNSPFLFRGTGGNRLEGGSWSFHDPSWREAAAIHLCFVFNKFIYVSLHWVFTALHGLSLTAVRPGCSLLGAQASHDSGFSCCRAQAQWLWRVGLLALWSVRSSRTRDRTCAPCLGRGILNHWTTREVQPLLLSHQVWEREKRLWPDLQGIRGKRGGSHSVSRVLILVRKWVSVVSSVLFTSVTQSCPTLCDPMDCRHTRPPCPSSTPGVCSSLCPSSWWCHPAISSSVVPFSSCPQSLPASGSFPMSQLFVSGGQSIAVSASASVLPMNTQAWSPSGWTGWISLQSKGLSRIFSNTIVQKHQFFCTQLSSQPTLTSIHDHWKNHSLD